MSDTTRSKLLELVADLRSKKAGLEKQYQTEIEKIDSDLQSVQRTLDLLFAGEDTMKQSKSQLQFDTVALPLISKAKNQMEAVKIMARQNKDYTINVTKAADTLIRAGRAKGKRRNLIGTVHNMLSNSDEWKWVSKGNFQLIEK